MAGISAKSIYGLSALLRLTKNDKNELTQIKDIATGANIPQAYLEQILPVLKGFGLIESIRGANGGYRLSKASNEICFYDVIMALEGSLFEVNQSVSSPGLKEFLSQLNEEVKIVFSKNLDEISQFVQKADENLVYYI